MSNPQLWHQVRELVRDQEIDVAIQIMEAWLKGRLDNFPERRISAWLDELLLHSANFNRVSARARKGLIGDDAEAVALSRLSLNLLTLVKIIEDQDNKDPTPVPELEPRPTDPEIHFEKILGTQSRLQMISWLRRGLECSTAVCRLVSHQTRATGFRIHDELIVTNNHVIATRENARQFIAQFFFEEAMDGKIGNPLSISLDEQRFWTSKDLDITIVGAHFAKQDGSDRILSLSMQEPDKTEIGDPVTIIQHPLGGPKQIALTYNNVMEISEHRLRYFTDTLPGSSGSPVFNSKWEVIAVHHAGGITLADAGKSRFANQGVRLQTILSDPVFKSIF